MLAPARWTGAAMLGLGVLVSDPADSATLREGLDGTWTGQGAIAAGYETTARTARCRVEVRQEDAANSLEIHATCATTAGRRAFTLRALFDDDTQVRAAVRANGTAETTQYAGTGTETGMELSATSPILLDGAYYQSRLRIDLLDDTRFRILHWLQPESADSARQTLAIEFHRIAEAP